MILSWRDLFETELSNRTFDGSGDVRMFFFFFETVAMCNKQRKIKAIELIKFIEDQEFE